MKAMTACPAPTSGWMGSPAASTSLADSAYRAEQMVCSWAGESVSVIDSQSIRPRPLTVKNRSIPLTPPRARVLLPTLSIRRAAVMEVI